MINILFGGNYKVFDGIMLCLISICKNTKEPINVYVLTADVTEINKDFKPIKEDDINFLKNYLKQKNSNNEISLIKLDKKFNNWILNGKNKLSCYTPFAFLRLFANEINLPEKIIYLDTDILCPGDIKELFDIDISNYEIGVVLDNIGKWFINSKYFNSGVMLMNLKELKRTNLLKDVRNLCSNKKMAFPDQSALNKLSSKVLYLPRRFNEQHTLKKDTVIQHFCKRIKWLPFFHTQNIKPWHIKDVQHVYKIHTYDDIYEEYLRIKKNLLTWQYNRNMLYSLIGDKYDRLHKPNRT